MDRSEVEKNAINAGLMKRRMNSGLHALPLRCLWESDAGGMRFVGVDVSFGLKDLHLRGVSVEAEVMDEITQ